MAVTGLSETFQTNGMLHYVTRSLTPSLVVLDTGTGTWSVLKYNFRVLVLVLLLACQVLVLVLVLVRKYLLPKQSHFLL